MNLGNNNDTSFLVGVGEGAGAGTDAGPSVGPGASVGVGVGASASASASASAGGSGEEKMPLSAVSRIMQKALPPNSQISDEAKMAVQSCLSEFIGLITTEANDHCNDELRKTISSEDILYGLNNLGFDSYVDPLTLYLNRYRQYENERNGVGVGGEPTTVSYPLAGVVQQSRPPPQITTVNRTASYPLAGVVHQSPPPPRMTYNSASVPATQSAPLHPNMIGTYYRVPPAPVAYNGGISSVPFNAMGASNVFPGGYVGVPFNAMSVGNAFPGGYVGVPFNAMSAATAAIPGGYVGVPFTATGAATAIPGAAIPGGYVGVPFTATGAATAIPGGVPFIAMGAGNSFPGGYGGVPFSAMGAVTTQFCSPRGGEHFIIARPTRLDGSGSTSVDNTHNMCFYPSGSSHGGGGGGTNYRPRS